MHSRPASRRRGPPGRVGRQAAGLRAIRHAWRVEVAHGRLGRSRRLAKSFENTITSATGMASGRLHRDYAAPPVRRTVSPAQVAVAAWASMNRAGMRQARLQSPPPMVRASPRRVQATRRVSAPVSMRRTRTSAVEAPISVRGWGENVLGQWQVASPPRRLLVPAVTLRAHSRCHAAGRRRTTCWIPPAVGRSCETRQSPSMQAGVAAHAETPCISWRPRVRMSLAVGLATASASSIGDCSETVRADQEVEPGGPVEVVMPSQRVDPVQVGHRCRGQDADLGARKPAVGAVVVDLADNRDIEGPAAGADEDADSGHGEILVKTVVHATGGMPAHSTGLRP